MTNSILARITEQYASFTRSEKKLANYILAHSSEAQYLTIHSLAENSAVSEATITRFCRTLGLPGYNSLKLALAKFEATAGAEASAAFEDTQSDGGLQGMALRLCDSYQTAFKETAEQLDPDSFTRAVDLLASARHVYCLGQGGSMVMAMEAWARFSTCSSAFLHISDSHMQAIAVSQATREDVILYFSYSGATRDYQDIAHLAKERGIPIILITHFKNSMAAQSASVILFCGYNENPLQSGCIPAKMGQLLLIDCLYNAYYSRNSAGCSAASAASAEAISPKHF